MQKTKEEYLREFEARLGQTETEIETLMVRATRSDYDEHLTSIRANQEIARAKLVAFKEAGNDKWLETRAELERVVSKVENALYVVSGGSEGEE